jgi:hypothetical protein
MQVITQSELSRSALLADMHWVDPNGCVRISCDTKTWTSWRTDDPSRMTADNMELMISVIKVRTVYGLRTLKNLVCLQVLLLAPLLSTLQGPVHACYMPRSLFTNALR